MPLAIECLYFLNDLVRVLQLLKLVRGGIMLIKKAIRFFVGQHLNRREVFVRGLLV